MNGCVRVGLVPIVVHQLRLMHLAVLHRVPIVVHHVILVHLAIPQDRALSAAYWNVANVIHWKSCGLLCIIHL